jgi:hypothetical protein
MLVMERPWSVRLACVYFVVFSLVLLSALLWPLITGQMHSRWADTAFPLAFALLVTLIPGVIALGLWVMDNAARVAAIVIAVLHAIATLHWFSHPLFGWQWLPPVRIAIDVVIIVAMLHPATRRAFRQSRIVLDLR